MPKASSRSNLLSLIGPGLLVAATGVGAGDLATAGFAGSQLGTAVLWAVGLGGFLKYILNEGLARWQLATGQTFLEGTACRFGRVTLWLFLPYMLLWSFFVGSALMSACGIALHALIPIFNQPGTGKMVFGIASSLAGLVLVQAGGFRLFEKVMTACIGVMFLVVIVTACRLWPGTVPVLRGLFVPNIPDVQGTGITWTVALMGGVGGTLTVLCYGYWIREEGRIQVKDLGICRIDLASGYVMTILFGLAMVIIGSTVSIEGRGAGLLVTLADQLEKSLGRWLFLIGAFSAIYSSLLGVWQAVPYLFADVWRLTEKRPVEEQRDKPAGVRTDSSSYRLYQVALAVVPMLGLWVSFKEIQKLYAVIGALFIPMLALALLILNGRQDWVGPLKNRKPTSAMLILTLLFFGSLALMKLF